MQDFGIYRSAGMITLFLCRQLEMLSSQPPLLLHALGLSPEHIQAELQKLAELDELKVHNNSGYVP